MMAKTNAFFALLYLVCLASYAHAQANYSTTFTTTTWSTLTSVTSTAVQTTSTTLDDVLTTTTATVQTTLDAATVTSTTTLAASTTTLSLASATQTVTNVAAPCTEYQVKFGSACCPTRWVRKASANRHPTVVKPSSHPQVVARSLSEPTLTWPVRRSEEGIYGAAIEAATRSKRDLSGPIATTSSCSVSSFMDFNTKMNTSTPIVTLYDFGVGGRMRIQDLYAVNVCGDIYLDGTKVASTTCPAMVPGADTSGNINDPDTAIASGKYGYVYVDIPAGVHNVSIVETYKGGQAFYQISSNAQCPALEYIDTETTTQFAVATQTLVQTVGPMTTIVAALTETITNTLADVVEMVTVTSDVVTQTIAPAPPVQTQAAQCTKQIVHVSCPSYKSQRMMNTFLKGQLQSTKQRNSNSTAPLAVWCGRSSTEYLY